MLVCGFLLVSLSAEARVSSASLDQRIYDHQQMLERGLQSGALSQHDYRHLERRLGQIQAEKGRLEAHGHLGLREMRRLDRDLDRHREGIRRKMRHHHSPPPGH